MAALDLAGITFNLRMLRSCLKNKENYTFLQKCQTLAICQCACQVTILVSDAIEIWKGLETESSNFFRTLSSSMLIFQGCKLMAILIIYFDQPTLHGTSELCSKLKISAALSLGLIGSAIIWWNSYFCQDSHIFQMVPLPVLRFVVRLALVVLLFAWDVKNIIDDQVEDDPCFFAVESSPRTSQTSAFHIVITFVFISNLKLVTSFGRNRGPEGCTLFSHHQIC